MFCKHEWNKVSETILPSAFEQVKNNIHGEVNFMPWMLRRKAIIILACKKCGKLYETVEVNP